MCECIYLFIFQKEYTSPSLVDTDCVRKDYLKDICNTMLLHKIIYLINYYIYIIIIIIIIYIKN